MNENIKKYLIEKFVKKYKRVPLESERFALFKSLVEEYPEVNEIGLSASNMKLNEAEIFFQAGTESKASVVQNSVKEILYDMDHLDKKYSSLIEEQKEKSIDQGRVFKNVEERISHLIKKVNLEILLKGKQDIFSYGIVEDFSTRGKVDTERSNVRILDNNKVTLAYLRSREERIDVNEVSYEVLHRKSNQLNFNIFGELKNILEEDDQFFKVESASEIEDDVVDFIFNIEFRIEKNIEQIKYKLQNLQTNSRIQEEVFFSVNGVDFNQLTEAVNVNNDIGYINFDNNVRKYKKIILKFRKTGFDYRKSNKFYYVFSFDYLSFIQNTYSPSMKGELFLGPYEIVDEDEAPVNYSLATIKAGTCCEIPNQTSINFYLSKDGLEYHKCGFSNESASVVAFGGKSNVNILEDFDIIDLNTASEFLVDDEDLIPEHDSAGSLEFLNVVLKEENVGKVNLNSLDIKRNVFIGKGKNTATFYSGWKKLDGFYECTLEINNGRGVTVNFGTQYTIYINGSEKAGQVFIPKGTHKIKVSDTFFSNSLNEKSITTERNLSRSDSHYPYNHKFLIEGFEYNKRFKGSKRYNKLGYIYASKLKLTDSNSFFEPPPSYDDCCILDISGSKYLIIYDTNQDGNLENYDITYQNRSLNEDVKSNRLYIKAVLETNSEKISPKIDQIQVRVI